MTLGIGSGTYSDEGAWVSPGSTITLSGGIHFPASDASPSEDFSVRVLLDGQESIIDSANGLWVVQLTAPSTSGSYPLTVEIANLPQGANDVTDTAAALRWIVVDLKVLKWWKFWPQEWTASFRLMPLMNCD